ncbi:MAG: TIGR03617 family F420-dependent LLM class oxidoreductase [Alphaproteobacteria bacterium]|nr:TIGR03617 family F420-dependent LLM class oxidoreductase [Alphaproteobacteria bacterium]MBV9863450.1 TIGR03617 family F420-dependent LLM class oxidoreductase [Alphaproteobacteria bacterium]
MRVFTTVPQHDLRRVGGAARDAESEGYNGIVAMENQHDPFLALAVAGAATERLELHTGVAIAFARTPMAVAEVGWDLAGSTDGRFVIGLGSQVRAHNERRFSVPWTPPAPRMREYVQVLRAIWHCWKTGEKPAYEGRHYRFTLMTPNFTPPPIAAPPPAVMIAAVGPAMLRVAAEECDGVKLHGFCTRKYLTDEIMPRIEAGLAKAGRRRAQYEISGGGFLATGPDDASVAERFEWVRQRVAFYGSTPAYYPVLAVHGLEDLGHKLNALVRQGKWSDLAGQVPDEVAHLFAAVGRHDQIARAIRDRFGTLVDALTLRGAGTGDVPPDLVQDIRNIPHQYQGLPH